VRLSVCNIQRDARERALFHVHTHNLQRQRDGAHDLSSLSHLRHGKSFIGDLDPTPSILHAFIYWCQALMWAMVSPEVWCTLSSPCAPALVVVQSLNLVENVPVFLCLHLFLAPAGRPVHVLFLHLTL